MVTAIPVAFLPENHALAIAIMSYNGQMNFGLLGDFDALPDIDSDRREHPLRTREARRDGARDGRHAGLSHAGVESSAPRRAQPEDLEAVTETLWLAFGEDPLWRWAFPDHAQLRALWRLYVSSALKYEWVWTIDDYAAATVWIPPGRPELTAEEEALVPELVGPRAEEVLGLFDAFERAHPARATPLLPDPDRDPSRPAWARRRHAAARRRTSSSSTPMARPPTWSRATPATSRATNPSASGGAAPSRRPTVPGRS